MKLVRLHGPGDTRLDDVPEPEPGPRDVIIDIAACGLCGSDLKYISMGGLGGPTSEPLPLGHEFSGTIIAMGAEVDELAIGQRVVVDPGGPDGVVIGNGGTEGAFADRVLVRDAADGQRVFPIPDELPFDIAALTEPVGVGMNAVDKTEVRAGDRVAVFGAGPIGLAAIAVSLDRGAADVVAVDLSPERLSIAHDLGAHAVIDPTDRDVWGMLRDRHGTSATVFGPMADTDAYIECSGAPSVITEVIANARREARLTVAGLHFADVPVSFLTVLSKELTIRGAMEYPERFEDALDFVSRCDVSAMITDRIALSDWGRVQTLIAGGPTFAKIMITMS